MFTVCPNCSKQFKIYAEHITAAAGQVRCGFCQYQFNALQHLYDKPLPAEKLVSVKADPIVVEQAPVETIDEPEFDLTDDSPEEYDVVDNIVDKESGDMEFELQQAIDEIGADNQPDSEQTAEPVASDPLDEIIESITPVEPAPEPSESPDTQSENFTFDSLDESLLEDEPVQSSRWVSATWTLVTVIALIGVVGQIAWFNRDQVLANYPEAGPYLKQFCEKYGCDIIRVHNPTAITMLNRDVRLHPTYEDTLLVNATMKNELDVKQAYPRVQLTLFDTNGGLLGYREFEPTDYLDSSIDIDGGMPVDAPVHFVLEVSGTMEDAVSFEFRFL